MTLQELAENFNEIKTAYEAGELNQEEYVNLLQGLDTAKAIEEGTEDLEKKSEMNRMINAALAAVSAI